MSTQPLHFQELPPAKMQARALEFANHMAKRRSVRDFSPRTVPAGVIEDCIRAAASSPSGANQQPWHFAVVRSAETKCAIRIAAEAEERDFYENRAPEEWLDALAPLGTDAEKPFLESAPVLIAIFQQSKALGSAGDEVKTYYPKESVGIATGILISALHAAGVATLTHTPSPMRFLNEILQRPASEKPFLLLVVGFPSKDCQIPVVSRREWPAICSEH